MKREGQVSMLAGVIGLWVASSCLFVHAQDVEREKAASDMSAVKSLPGLKRFSTENQLGFTSHFQVREIAVGDNVMTGVMALHAQGGEVQYISGGSRSRKVETLFFQPYQDSQLVQRVTLHFDTDKGFVTSSEVNYAFASAYLSIEPIKHSVFTKLVQRYGEPDKFDTYQRRFSIAPNRFGALSVSKVGEAVAATIPMRQTQQRVNQFFKGLDITRQSGFYRDEQGYALLKSGFRECFIWSAESPTNWMLLCAMSSKSGNRNTQGVDLIVQDFAVFDAIEAYSPQSRDIIIDL
ncbi:hypothetical protein OE749_00100 [Aestuariibacter sp. AA17]|uniref:Uncharacterized protein n=1 Tax=Fluctibacter corallii TaxID=2984329 RepID=A0ABT3A340_9ALTE|nr:hypothetical protein [Aestuariibacter sp. AA17]MCV2883095.1 hypothetical protein [Aestuariibacter sp. AA17]